MPVTVTSIDVEPLVVPATTLKVALPSLLVVDGVVTKDDGVLSPLTNVTYFFHCFYNSFVCDKHLLWRKEGEYAIESF